MTGSAAAIVLAGLVFVAWGVAFLRSDRDPRWANGVGWRRYVVSPFRLPRDAVFGYVPGGIGLMILGVGTGVSRHASIVGLYVALIFWEIGGVLVLRPPELIKPAWLLHAERIGTRARRMDRWDRWWTIVGIVGIPVFAVSGIVMLAVGPPLSLGW